MSNVIIECHNLSFIDPSGVKLINNISCKISRGRIVALLGRSDSHKEILLQILNGLIPRFSGGILEGEAIVDGLNVKDHTVEELSRIIYTVLPDPVAQVVETTVYDDVALGPSNMLLPTQEIKKRVSFALEATRLKGFENRNTYSLSGGEQQRLAIAGGLAMLPKVMCMIDPFSMLDPIGKEELVSIIKQLKKQYEMTFLITDGGKNIEVINKLADEVILMDKGEIKARGPPNNIFNAKEAMKIIEPPQVMALFLKLRDSKLFDSSIPVDITQAERWLRNFLKDRKLPSYKKNYTRKYQINKPIIRVRNLKHTFPSFPPVEALRGVSLDIYPGEFVAIIGPNGGGKTTLAKHLVGLLKPTNSDAVVEVAGLNVIKTPMNELVRHINYVFQNPNDQIFTETVWDEIAFGPRMIGLTEEEVNKRVRHMLKEFGLEEQKDENPLYLSPGKKTLLAIASVMSMDPEILIVDEPTGGLDCKEAHDTLKVLQKMNKIGKTIIIITHDMKIVCEYCTRVIVLLDGTVLLQGRPEQVFSKAEMLKKAFIEPPPIVQLANKLNLPKDIMSVDDMYLYLREVASWSG